MDNTRKSRTAFFGGKFYSLSVWALSFGSLLGWGAFVMPGTTFLPSAGPLGTLIGLVLGALFMMIIAANLHNVISRKSTGNEASGIFTCTKEVFGYDHSFLCMWALALAYISILWANASAFALIIRVIFGDVLRQGFSYTIGGYQIYLLEVLTTISVLVFFAVLICLSEKYSRLLNTILAVILFCGIVGGVICLLVKSGATSRDFQPAFLTHVFQNGAVSSRKATIPFVQVLEVLVMAPWAFVGFEAASFCTDKEHFYEKQSFLIMAVSVFCGALCYILLACAAVVTRPSIFYNWQEYIAMLPLLSGVDSMPTFRAVYTILGKPGTIILFTCFFAGSSTGVLCMYRSLARLLASLAKDEIIPHWFAKRNSRHVPQNAIIFVGLVSLIIPFFGRQAIGWIVDVTTMGACISYIYISASCIIVSKEIRMSESIQHQHRYKSTYVLVLGIAGVVLSLFLFMFPLIPNFWSMNEFSTESYVILGIWSILGFVIFRFLFKNDKRNRFGKSTVMWLTMFFIVLFSSSMWMRKKTYIQSEKAIDNISTFHYAEHSKQEIPMTKTQLARERNFMEEEMQALRNSQLMTSLMQFMIVMLMLLIMFNIFNTQKKREYKIEEEKLKAEESNKAKTVFLSNMSHDIRTPMNAIIGYTNIARRPNLSKDEVQEYLQKIDASSKHLLSLINDVLEMSRIESGKMEIEEIPCDLNSVLDEIRDMFATQMTLKNIDFQVEGKNLTNPLVYCDRNRLNRVILNLLSNSYKFTNDGGRVSFVISQVTQPKEGVVQYEFRVKDNGIGMSPEFSKKIFEAFEREHNSTVSGIQGTGLGMTITKSIVDMMGGVIDLNTKKGEGTEFIIKFPFRIQEAEESESVEGLTANSQGESGVQAEDFDFSKCRLLLVDDVDVNREIAVMLLTELGFMVETAINGQDAVEKLEAAEAGYFDAVLMDIQMPVMDGYQATAKIRAFTDEKKAQLPVIAMTANAFSEDVKKALEAGMNGHVAKPINMDNLIAVLKKELFNA